MKQEIRTDVHKSVGPVFEMYGHGPVFCIGSGNGSLWVCLDCGYTTGDNRLLAHTECDREKNTTNVTLREWIAENVTGKEILPESDNDNYPLE